MTPTEDLENRLFEAQVTLGTLEKSAKAAQAQYDELQKQHRQFLNGLRDAQRQIKELKLAPVVSASQYRLMRDMKKTFTAKVNSTNAKLAMDWPPIAEATATIVTLRTEIESLTKQIEESSCVILEFPARDLRRSQEED
jgi:chromosome segregation ATPase